MDSSQTGLYVLKCTQVKSERSGTSEQEILNAVIGRESDMSLLKPDTKTGGNSGINVSLQHDMILNYQLDIAVCDISAVTQPRVRYSPLWLEIAVIAGNVGITFGIIVADIVVGAAAGVDIISEKV